MPSMLMTPAQELDPSAPAHDLGDRSLAVVQGRFPSFYTTLLRGVRQELLVAGRRTTSGGGAPCDLPALVDDHLTHLVRELDLLCIRTLIAVFHEDRERRGLSYAEADQELGRPERQEEILRRLPELRRLIDLLRARALRDLERLLGWVREDHVALEARFGPLGRLQSAEPGLGDPHAQGATVTRTRWEHGAELILKPRSPRPDTFLAALRDRLDPVGSFFGPVIPGSWGREDRLWQRCAAAQPLSAQEAPAWYRRLGRCAALWHALGATDLHFENLICTSSGPVLIDAETLTSLPTAPRRRQTAVAGLGHHLDGSVLRMWLFPSLFLGDRIDVNISGIGGGDEQLERSGRLTSIGVVDAGTDRIRFAESAAQVDAGRNVPRVDGQAVDPRDHLEEVLQGYRQAAALIRGQHGALEDVLRDTAPGDCRQVYRPTWIYSRFLDASTHPSRMGSRQARRQTFELLSKQFRTLSGAEAPAVREVEIEALMHLDMPLFEISGQSPVVIADRRMPVDATVPHSAEGCMRWWWRQFASRDVEEEIGLIRTSMTTVSPDVWQGGGTRWASAGTASWTAPRSVWSADRESCTWLTGLLVGRRIRLGGLGLGLYQSSGQLIALADGAGGPVPQREAVVRAAARGLAAPGFDVDSWGGAAAACSAYTGAFAHDAVMLALARRGLVDDALSRDTARRVDEVCRTMGAHLGSAEDLDLVNGWAGALVGLRAAQTQMTLPASLGPLLERCVEDRADDLRRWTRPQGSLGLGHGWAGRLLGLVCAQELLDALGRGASDAPIRGAVLDGVEQYLADRPRDEALLDPAGCGSWCKGAAGLVVALVRALELQGRSRRSIAEALRPELELTGDLGPEGPVDLSLCHGAAGQLGVLAWAGRHLEDAALHDRAERLLRQAEERMDRWGWRSGLAQVPETDAHFLGRSGWAHVRRDMQDATITLPLLTGGEL